MLNWLRNKARDTHDEIIDEQEREIARLRRERENALDEMADVRGELRTLEQKRDAEERDIQHLLKLEREREEVKREKFEAKCEREKDAAIAEVKDEYREKLEQELRSRHEDMRGMYTEILQRLPNVTAHLEK